MFVNKGIRAMKKGHSRNSFWWVLFALAAVGLAAGLGCGASSAPAETGSSAVAAVAPVSVGNQVGDRVTPFTLRLADGTTLTSGDLIDRNRPTLLFFFKKG